MSNYYSLFCRRAKGNLPYLNFTSMNFHDCPPLLVNTVKLAPGGHETFQKPAFLQAGGGCACRLPFTAAPRFQFIALHALAGKALACSK